MKYKVFQSIDKLWFNTDLGKYVKYGSVNDEVKGKALIESLYSIHPNWQYVIKIQEKETAISIKNILGEIDYFEYLKYLDTHNKKMLNFMISHDILIDIDSIINNQYYDLSLFYGNK